ncbi:Pbp4p KNAG_0D04290 [Huiozyma naganishii CBS 8797]|uniref:Uncharacterized protein n=1 Tax=Huiozyma naganishii (strain ATCC MYA-139 / BCRC 22969 / CBS 8797 / KCTC 17520 / NBRC 10181 / NCYC 3082 / Yp74L-3) TaxID=1071383 RepID=J7R5P1_HUIN7|nr:hypothetical protein KNAG_0D04290 [Kazachstania naganishii CBS 8797]CCK70175.1 hypothetical protein KNAG_0D04290 [Kazachstania naganishii CBS 8797]
MATTTPKLTGWAQAAARSAPKHSRTTSAVNAKADAVAATEKSATGSPTPSHSPAAAAVDKKANHTGTTGGKKTAHRPPFNRDEVRKYMDSLFDTYANAEETVSYDNILQNNKNLQTANWGTVSSGKNKNKNKKYGYLADIAKVLKN